MIWTCAVVLALVAIVSARNLLGGSGGGRGAPARPRDVRDPIGSRLLAKLAAGRADASILVLGDSTGNEAGEWPDLLLRDLAKRFPRYTAAYRQFDLRGFAPVWSKRGSGPHTLTLYNASWGGTTTRWDLPFTRIFGSLHADLIFISHGHNEGALVPAEPYWRDDLLALTESVSLASPSSEIVLIAQNPRTADASMGPRRYVTRTVAQARGYGFVNVWRAFEHAAPGGRVASDPAAGSLLLADGVHPNAAGQRVWADAVRARMRELTQPLAARPPSSLSAPVENLVADGDFAAFAPPEPPGWKRSGVRLSRDAAHHEGPGFALRMRAVGGLPASIAQDLPDVARLRGEWITAGIRVRIPDGTRRATVGRVAIAQRGGVDPGRVASTALPDGRGGFMWVTVSRRIDVDAEAVRVTVYADTGSSGTADVTIDRVVVARGTLPRDVRG